MPGGRTAEFFLPLPIMELTRSCSVQCSLIFLLPLKIYNSSLSLSDTHAWETQEFPYDQAMEHWPTLLSTSLLGAHLLESQKIHLPLWEIAVTKIVKEILGVLSSHWEVRAHSCYKRIQVPPLMSKLQYHPSVLCTFNRPGPRNSLYRFSPCLFFNHEQADSIGKSIWDLVNYTQALGNNRFQRLEDLQHKELLFRSTQTISCDLEILQNIYSLSIRNPHPWLHMVVVKRSHHFFQDPGSQMFLCPFLGPSASFKSPLFESPLAKFISIFDSIYEDSLLAYLLTLFCLFLPLWRKEEV